MELRPPQRAQPAQVDGPSSGCASRRRDVLHASALMSEGPLCHSPRPADTAEPLDSSAWSTSSREAPRIRGSTAASATNRGLKQKAASARPQVVTSRTARAEASRFAQALSILELRRSHFAPDHHAWPLTVGAAYATPSAALSGSQIQTPRVCKISIGVGTGWYRVDVGFVSNHSADCERGGNPNGAAAI